MIHRDIKPSNLLLDNDGVVWLTDFGLAKRIDEATLTVHGTLMGTPRYMSPEQAASLQQPIDRRTDLYSLGASLYELATGRPVFESATPHVVIAQILTEEPARPRQLRPTLPRDLETIILTCLAKEPAKRYQSAQALASDLRAVLEGRPIQARRAPARRTGCSLRPPAAQDAERRRRGRGGHRLAHDRCFRSLALLQRLAARPRCADDRRASPRRPRSYPRLGRRADRRAVLHRRPQPSSPCRPATTDCACKGRGSWVRPTGSLSTGARRGPITSRSTTTACWGPSPSRISMVTEAVDADTGQGRLHRVDRRDPDSSRRIDRQADLGRRAACAALGPRTRPGRLAAPAVAIRRPRTQPGELVQPAPDLDGDGTGDLVWAMHGTPSLLAVSGKDGSLLWTYSADPDGPGAVTIGRWQSLAPVGSWASRRRPTSMATARRT